MKKGMRLLAHSLIIQLDPLLVLCQDFLQPHGPPILTDATASERQQGGLQGI